MTLKESQRLENAWRLNKARLLDHRQPGGYWQGELSTSALSTALAAAALSHAGSTKVDLALSGLEWLAQNQNTDGGWGDTTISHSNISTTALVLASFRITRREKEFANTVAKAQEWLRAKYGADFSLAKTVKERYGKDHTFSVPILATCAIADMVPWKEVPSLPFELGCLPQSWFRFLGLPVVSYALPALLAIGQCIHHHQASRVLPLRWLRDLCRGRANKVLAKIQPTNGGFLEATPLTAFVALTLSASGLGQTPVVLQCLDFLEKSARPDGGWAIDTNLATWVTSLSVNALASSGELDTLEDKSLLAEWILNQQYRTRHPYTGADPGGWSWTPLPGGVPDADDTPGALLALTHLGVPPGEWLDNGVKWLSGLQNRDQGMPTFCRGWGTLPFDRSGCDLTAHTLRAIAPWYLDEIYPVSSEVQRRLGPDMERLYDGGLYFLYNQQSPEGAWLPLWFGNQFAPEETNPVFGTTRVLAAFRDLGMTSDSRALAGVRYLEQAQNHDGGWGGAPGCPSSLEETGLALDVLCAFTTGPNVLHRGLLWLINAVENGQLENPTPIGFYFARLWYWERLYPVIFALGGLGRVRRSLKP
ncbi:MAG: squalene--hopene cyclase [Gemmataceae bacterium]|nr:squalene--hopene cyclase [Gemmataceae bacterium]